MNYPTISIIVEREIHISKNFYYTVGIVRLARRDCSSLVEKELMNIVNRKVHIDDLNYILDKYKIELVKSIKATEEYFEIKFQRSRLGEYGSYQDLFDGLLEAIKKLYRTLYEIAMEQKIKNSLTEGL